MNRRLLSLSLLVAGVTLLAFAGCGGSENKSSEPKTAPKQGGVFRYGSTSDVDAIDPAIAYGTISWWLEYATAAKLFNYPDKQGAQGGQLHPEVASSYKVSNDGKTYTFTVRDGFKFSDGKPVTAENFKFAINRVLNKNLNSPGAAFITDPSGTNIVGASDVLAGKATEASGVQVQGNKLIIHLEQANGAFLSQISMPFFQATSTTLPLDHAITAVSGNKLPSAGPYYVSNRQPDRSLQLKRNQYYKNGPGRDRPHYLNGVLMSAGVNEQTGFLQVMGNELDRGPLPAAQASQMSQKFGVNKTRYWVKPQTCVLYLALNTSRPLFKDNVPLRQAVNYVLRRSQIAAQSGQDGAIPYTHVLPPLLRGASQEQIYPTGEPNLAKAKQLAHGNTRSGKAILYYFNDTPSATAEAQIEKDDLSRIGIDAELRGYKGFQLFEVAGRRDSPHDITQAGWCQDYPDPYDFVNILLYGKSIHANNNVNLAYFDSPAYNQKMLDAARKVGPDRFTTYSQLDLDIMKNAAPWAVTDIPNNRFIFSSRVNPESLVYQGVYQDWSIPALAVKG